jgi:hypothetical protein
VPHLQDFRAGKPDFYPDQSIYAEYACAELGLSFEEIDRGTGLAVNVASSSARISFGAGRCSWYPQNDATASSLASDKYFTNLILERAGLPTLGGRYFFLHDRHRAHRPPGHERADAVNYFAKLHGSAFVKPLQGSRGDFAQAVHGEAALQEYLDRVTRYYDSILMQRIVNGSEYRVFMLNGEALFTAHKYPPALIGDGSSALRDLLAAHNAALQSRGLSPAADGAVDIDLSMVMAGGERWEIPGRMNLSAGGRMSLETLPAGHPAYALAQGAARALNLRVAAVDLFTDVGGDRQATKIIEVNANPSIRLLEDCGRSDLILKIWHHIFSATGLLDV